MQEKSLATMVGRIHERVTTPRAPVFASLALVMVTSFVVFLGLLGTGLSFHILARADPTYRGKKVSERVMLLDEEEAVAALEAEDWGIRSAAASALGKLGPAAKTHRPAIQEAHRKEDSWLVRDVLRDTLLVL